MFLINYWILSMRTDLALLFKYGLLWLWTALSFHTLAVSFSRVIGSFVCLMITLYGSFLTLAISSWNVCRAFWVITLVLPEIFINVNCICRNWHSSNSQIIKIYRHISLICFLIRVQRIFSINQDTFTLSYQTISYLVQPWPYSLESILIEMELL